jgi:hypothetical protein
VSVSKSQHIALFTKYWDLNGTRGNLTISSTVHPAIFFKRLDHSQKADFGSGMWLAFVSAIK